MAYVDEVLADAPGLYWRFNETSGTVADDATANNLDGTIFGGVTLGATGLVADGQTAYALDGTSGYVRITNNTAVQQSGLGSFSVEAWIKPAVTSGTGYIASKFSTTGGWEFWRNGAVVSFRRRFESTGTQTLSTPANSLVAGTKYHVVATFDGSTMRIFINGTQVASVASSNASAVETNPFFAGAVGGGNGNSAASGFFSGDMDDVAFYKTALSSTRIGAHYTAGSTQVLNYSDTATIATFTGAASAPTLVLDSRLDAPVAASAVSAPVPVVGSGVSLEAPLSEVTAEALAPDFGLGWRADPPVAGFSASAGAPTVTAPNRAYTDFSNYATNAQPTDWALTGSGSVLTQVTSGAIGGKTLNVTRAGTALALTAGTWSFLGDRGDQTFATRISGSIPNLQGVEGLEKWTYGVALHLASASACYILGVGNGGSGVKILKIVGGVSTVVASVARVATASPYIKAEMVGAELRVKVWSTGAEPAAWTLTYTDPSPLAAGRSGVAAYNQDTTTATKFDIAEFDQEVGLSRVAPAPVSIQWNLLPDATVYAGLRWADYVEAATSRSLDWNVGEFVEVGTSVSASWDTYAEVNASLDTRWEAVVEVKTSRTTRWHALNNVDRQRTLRYNVLDRVQSIRVLPWNVGGTVRADRALFWDEFLRVEATSPQLRWVVNGDPSIVLKSTVINWRTLTPVPEKTLSVRWLSSVAGNLSDDFIVDFSKYALGQTPGDWAVELFRKDFLGGEGGGLVVARQDAIGGRVLRLGSSLSNWHSWSQEPTLSDQDITLRVNTAESLNLRIGDDRIKYEFTVNKNGGATIRHQNNFQVFGSATGSTPPWATGQYMWMRVQNLMARNITPPVRQVKVKFWPDGLPEPADWNVTYTDTQGSGSYYRTVVGPFQIRGAVDLDWIGYVNPNVRVTLLEPARAQLAAIPPDFGLTKRAVVENAGRARITALPPSLEIGDQVLVSWFAFEVPAPVATAAELVAPPLVANMQALEPSVLIQNNHSIEVPVAAAAAISVTPPFLVRAEIGKSLEVENAGLVNVQAFDADVVIRMFVYLDVETVGEATFQPLDLTLVTERNALVVVENTPDTRLNAVSPGLLGYLEAQVENAGSVTLRGLVPAAIKALVSVSPPPAEITVSAPEPSLRISTRQIVPVVGSGTARAFAPTVASEGKVFAEVGLVTVRSREPLTVRLGWKEFSPVARVRTEALEPAVNAVFTPANNTLEVENVALAYAEAFAPEFRFTPAEVGDAVVVYLGAHRAEVRLGARKSDAYLGSTRGSVVIAEVRDEVKA